ncbi:MAG: hypothetical protein AB7I30_05240 [Isosphaeraceae bacterium]
MPPYTDSPPNAFGSGPLPDVVEIGLLLPASWAVELVEMSKRRGQSVAQILRGMIDLEISTERALRN